MSNEARYSWTQPICRGCWSERQDDARSHNPCQATDAVTERCCYCGEPATAGIYVRVDPSTVPFPEPVA